jgi:hypothetical protein
MSATSKGTDGSAELIAISCPASTASGSRTATATPTPSASSLPPPPGANLIVSLLAGGDNNYGYADGIGTSASIGYYGSCIAPASGDSFYFADPVNYVVRTVSLSGLVATVAGSGELGYADGVGTNAAFNWPMGVQLVGNALVVADSSNDCLRNINTATLAVTTFVGACGQSGFADGFGTLAQFSFPVGVAAASTGALYVSDVYNYALRSVSPSGIVTTLAGSGGSLSYGSGYSGDGLGSNAMFWFPQCIAVRPSDGLIIVADAAVVRSVTPEGVVTTLAGSPGYFSSASDGIGSNAVFLNAYGVAFDLSESLFVTDADARTVRSISPIGSVAFALCGSSAASAGSFFGH